jgi:hypothetical protein
MYAELICQCGSSFNMDLAAVSDADLYADQVWTFVWRFANAHIRCGYFVSGASVDPEEFNASNTMPIRPVSASKPVRKARPRNAPKNNPEST